MEASLTCLQAQLEFNVLVSSISFVKPGAKAIHTTATPQEVTFFAPRAPHVQFEFRQDLLVAALFQNYLLAERIMKNYHCTPHTSPALLPTSTHLMWASWDLVVDACIAQLPRLLHTHNADGEPIPEHDRSLIDPYQYIPSSFFSDSLMAFDVWISHGGCALTKRSS